MRSQRSSGTDPWARTRYLGPGLRAFGGPPDRDLLSVALDLAAIRWLRTNVHALAVHRSERPLNQNVMFRGGQSKITFLAGYGWTLLQHNVSFECGTLQHNVSCGGVGRPCRNFLQGVGPYRNITFPVKSRTLPQT